MTCFLEERRSNSKHELGETVFETSKFCVNLDDFKCRTINVLLLTLFAFVAAAPWACAQKPAQPASQPVDISVNVDEVSLDLVVHDKKNKPVLDLKQGEVAVTDNGAPVPLKSLRLVSKEQPGESLITLVFDRPSPVAGQLLETDPAIMKNAREAAAKVFKVFPEKTFSFSVLSVEGRLRLQTGFTSDRNVLTQAVEAATRPAKDLNTSAVSESEKQLIAEVGLTELEDEIIRLAKSELKSPSQNSMDVRVDVHASTSVSAAALSTQGQFSSPSPRALRAELSESDEEQDDLSEGLHSRLLYKEHGAKI